ncbi:MAG: sulfatase [Myxococcales bacterium]|nr:sulfatase [Myxococcales bacterium]
MPDTTSKRLYCGLLFCLAAFTFCLALTGCAKSPNHPNVLLISVDTLRADRLGCYGSKEGLTGMMDFWAQRGVRFSNTWAPAPWTLPSHASAFTGLYPTEHRAIDEKINIDKNAKLLSEALKDAGFQTGAFVSHYYLGQEYGFGRGFDDFYIKPDAKADEMVSRTARWIQKHKEKPFFAFLHLFDPHTPYQPPVDIAKKHYPADVNLLVTGTTKDIMDVVHEWPSDTAQKKLKALQSLYAGEIEFVDKQLEVLFKSLQDNKLDRNTIIILFADHGEEFMEHGLMEHGFTLYQEQLHVPFIWYYPAGLPAGQTVEEPSSLIDLMPTLLDLLGLPPVDNISGRSLMPVVRGQEKSINRYLLSETTRQGPDRVTLIRDFEKYLYSPPFRLNSRNFGEMLFNLRNDPGEKTDLLPTDPETGAKLSGELFASGLYVHRRAWHLRWGKGDKGQPLKGELRTNGKFIYLYKNNTIYSTDDKGLMTSMEFPWDKKDDNKVTFVNNPNEENGISFMTEPETAPITFQLLVGGKESPANIWLGGSGKHPTSGLFTLNETVELTGQPQPPAGGYLIWSDSLWVNAKQVLRSEVGDPIKLAPEVVEHLRSLGYIQ